MQSYLHFLCSSYLIHNQYYNPNLPGFSPRLLFKHMRFVSELFQLVLLFLQIFEKKQALVLNSTLFLLYLRPNNLTVPTNNPYNIGRSPRI